MLDSHRLFVKQKTLHGIYSFSGAFDIFKHNKRLTFQFQSRQLDINVKQLVDEHKVVLDVLLGHLAEVLRHHIDHAVQELEHHNGIDVGPGHGAQPDAAALHVEEARARNVSNGRAHLLARVDYVHAERVHDIPAQIITEDARDDHLALVVVDEEAANHSCVAIAILTRYSMRLRALDNQYSDVTTLLIRKTNYTID